MRFLKVLCAFALVGILASPALVFAQTSPPAKNTKAACGGTLRHP